jgi:hypothetical protein
MSHGRYIIVIGTDVLLVQKRSNKIQTVDDVVALLAS